jgi:hypothetical protein
VPSLTIEKKFLILDPKQIQNSNLDFLILRAQRHLSAFGRHGGDPDEQCGPPSPHLHGHAAPQLAFAAEHSARL